MNTKVDVQFTDKFVAGAELQIPKGAEGLTLAEIVNIFYPTAAYVDNKGVLHINRSSDCEAKEVFDLSSDPIYAKYQREEDERISTLVFAALSRKN